MKSIKKLFTMGLAVMMALSIPFSVSAAELEDAPIDESRTGSLTIYKYGLTNAEKDGVWDSSYVSTGVFDQTGVNDVLGGSSSTLGNGETGYGYAIKGVEFSYLKVADIVTFSESENDSRTDSHVEILYAIDKTKGADFLKALNLADGAQRYINADALDETKYQELWNDIQQYNRKLFQTRQEGIKGLESLEESCFQLSDYGISSEVFGVLAIPALDLEMPVYLGASSQNMALGAAQLGQTSIPVGGKNTNTVIAGHRGWNGADYFRYITELVPGDRITITNLWETLEYTVVGTRIISPDDVDAIKIQPEKDMITLFTCHPYASGGRQRYLVFCERINSEIRKDDSK